MGLGAEGPGMSVVYGELPGEQSSLPAISFKEACLYGITTSFCCRNQNLPNLSIKIGSSGLVVHPFFWRSDAKPCQGEVLLQIFSWLRDSPQKKARPIVGTLMCPKCGLIYLIEWSQTGGWT